MSEKEQPVSPEEKLLKVIKGEENTAQKTAPAAIPVATPKPAAEPVSVKAPAATPAPPAARKAPAAPAAPVTPVAQVDEKKAADRKDAKPAEEKAGGEPAKKAKLKVAAPEAAPSKTPVSAPVSAAGLIGVGGPVVSSRRRPPLKVGIHTLNRVLLVAALLMLGLTAFEIYANASLKSAPPASSPPDAVVAGSSEVAALRPLEQIVQAFQANPLFGTPDLPPPVPVNPQNPVVPSVAWQDYVRKSMKLMGQMGDPIEAIVFDEKEGKMLFLKAGQKVTVAEQELTVQAVQGDRVELTDGKNKANVM